MRAAHRPRDRARLRRQSVRSPDSCSTLRASAAGRPSAALRSPRVRSSAARDRRGSRRTRGLSRSLTTLENGITSCLITLYPPTKDSRPIRQNWCTPLNALIVGPVADGHVSGERDRVTEHAAAADGHIVRDVRIGHQQVVVADLCQQAAALGAAMNRDELADRVPVADPREGALAFVFLVLRGDADRGIREKRCCLRRWWWGLRDRDWPSAGCARRSPLPRR